MTDEARNQVIFGWGAPPMKEQHPVLGDEDAAHFDADNAAMIRLSVRGYMTDSQKHAVMKRITKRIGAAISAALAKAGVGR